MSSHKYKVKPLTRRQVKTLRKDYKEMLDMASRIFHGASNLCKRRGHNPLVIGSSTNLSDLNMNQKDPQFLGCRTGAFYHDGREGHIFLSPECTLHIDPFTVTDGGRKPSKAKELEFSRKILAHEFSHHLYIGFDSSGYRRYNTFIADCHESGVPMSLINVGLDINNEYQLVNRLCPSRAVTDSIYSVDSMERGTSSDLTKRMKVSTNGFGWHKYLQSATALFNSGMFSDVDILCNPASILMDFSLLSGGSSEFFHENHKYFRSHPAKELPAPAVIYHLNKDTNKIEPLASRLEAQAKKNLFCAVRFFFDELRRSPRNSWDVLMTIKAFHKTFETALKESEEKSQSEGQAASDGGVPSGHPSAGSGSGSGDPRGQAVSSSEAAEAAAKRGSHGSESLDEAGDAKGQAESNASRVAKNAMENSDHEHPIAGDAMNYRRASEVLSPEAMAAANQGNQDDQGNQGESNMRTIRVGLIWDGKASEEANLAFGNTDIAESIFNRRPSELSDFRRKKLVIRRH